jgi:hypothetical protein
MVDGHEIEARWRLAEPHKTAEPVWLEGCPPNIRAVYDYWKSKAGDRRMPARADIDPIDLAPYLASVMLVDVRPGSAHTPGAPQHQFVYRLVGTLEVEMRGRDPTGQNVAKHAFGRNPELALRIYNAVVQQAAPMLDRREENARDRQWCDLDAIFLPLSNDGVSVNMILVYTLHRRFAS